MKLKKVNTYLKPFVPRSIIMRRNIARAEPQWKLRETIFIHVPKNGGSSISTMLYGKVTGHFTYSEIEKYAPESLEQYKTFAISRNPWDRLYSAYLFVQQNKNNKIIQKISHSDLYSHADFSNFESFVESWLPNRIGIGIDQIFWKQTDFVKNSDGRVAVDNILRIEDKVTLNAHLSQILLESKPLVHLNKTEKKMTYKQVYTSSMKNVAAEIYADDVRLLDYEF